MATLIEVTPITPRKKIEIAMTQKLLMFFMTTLLLASQAHAGVPVAFYRPGDTIRVVVTANDTADACSLVVYDPDFDKHQGSVLPFHSGGGKSFTWTGYWVVPASPDFGEWSGISVLWDTIGTHVRVGGANTVWSVTDTFLTVTTLLDKDGYTLTSAEKTSIADETGDTVATLSAQFAGETADSVGFETAPSTADIADAVWDEAQSGHVGAGSFGKYLDAQVSDKDGYTLTVAEKESIAAMSARETLDDSSHYKSLLTADDIATRVLDDTTYYQAKGVGITQADQESIAVMSAREVLKDSSHYKSLLTAEGVASVTADSVLKDSSSYQGAVAESCTLSDAQVALIASVTADTVLQDSTHYQGSASGLTADAIALAMWSSLHADYADSTGSFGAYIDAKISDMGVILGSKPVRVYLKDAADSTILGNVEVQLYNKNDTTYSDLLYVSYTNTSGWIDLNLDTLTYWLRWEHPQYVASTDSFTVADDDTMQGFIFYATAFSPPSPSVDSTCVVWGRLRKATGEYAADIKVQFVLEPSDPAFYMEKLLDRRKVETMTDSIGFWSVAVYPNSRITPLGTGYKVKIWGDPIIEAVYIVPPDTSAPFNSLEKWDD